MSVPKLENLDCKYGAPMGRRAYWPQEEGRDAPKTLKVYLHKLEFTDGCYDKGGAYWGGPATVYRAIDAEGEFCFYLRADTREEAIESLLSEFPTFTFTFYRGTRRKS